ncbi:MAG: hypothetical protein ACTSPI_01245 [Candidatus Heimdallarchaeaceae archaeon]
MASANTPYQDGHVWDDQDANWSVGFGDGTDGAFSESSGTTNLTQGTVYQYTSFLLDTNATLSASSTSDKPIIIYVQGNCTINGTIDLKGKGCPTSFTAYWDPGVIDYGVQDKCIIYPAKGSRGGYAYEQGTTASAKTKGGIKGGLDWNFQNNQRGFIMNGTAGSVAGSNNNHRHGGGGGASSANNGLGGEISSDTSGDYGAGGEGGCTIFIKVGGTLTFGADSSIDVSGNDGADASGAGGGGGGAGDILIFHRGAKTDNGLATDVTGGAGGTDTTNGNGDGGAGGAGTEKIADWATISW